MENFLQTNGTETFVYKSNVWQFFSMYVCKTMLQKRFVETTQHTAGMRDTLKIEYLT